ncbi:MAG: FkbM family methyltransferase [Ferruginibacter sp.]
MQSFKKNLQKEIEDNLFNNYTDNWDYTIFGTNDRPATANARFFAWVKKILPQRFIYNRLFKLRLQQHVDGMSRFSNLLQDEYSKNLLIQLLAYRLMGHKKIRLPLSNAAYWKQMALAESLIKDQTDCIDPGFRGIKLYKHDLNELGYPVQLYFMSFGVLVDYIIKQYEFNRDGVIIKAEENDIVIDAGGCWGDTALFFAHETGEHGKVYSFEFIPGNITLFNKNMALNAALSKRIELIKNPLWSEPGLEMYYNDFGPASRVSFEKFENATGKTQTQTIDNFVKIAGLPKVDFIKMDIEGAEMNSLKGARETLIRFKPKLAIAVYHDLADFYTIAEYLKSLNVGYKFYLAHYTIHSGETILYAKI